MKKFAIVAIAAFFGASAAFAKNIQHPSLLFTQDRVEQSKNKCKNDTAYANAYAKIIDTADNLLGKNDVKSMEYLALAYQLTSDKKYSDKIREMLIKVAETDTWIDKEMALRKPAWRSELQMAHKSFQLAVAYDAIYNTLSQSDKKQIATGLYRLAVEPLLGDWIAEPSRIHTLNSMGHNWWSSCVGMGGLLALAISNEVPEAAELSQMAVDALPEWFDFAGDVIQHKPKTFDREGGMYESVNYAAFGISEALLLRMAWLNARPDYKLEPIEQLPLISDYFIQVGYPRSEGIHYSLNFGDSHKNANGERAMTLAYAMGEKNPDILWYLKQITPGQHKEGFELSTPVGFLYRPDLSKAPDLPSAATDRMWEDFGWATMRTDYNPDATMLAVKSGMTWNHAHADAGSLILFHKGHDIIRDGGNCYYSNPQYRNYFFQSEAHNVVLFNGEGQSKYHQYHGTMLPGSVSGLIGGDNVKYVMADATGPTSDNFARNMRHYLWLDDVILVIDDLKSHEAGEYEWLWHPGGDVKKSAGDLVITRDNASAVIRPLYPETLVPSNFVHDYPEKLTWEVRSVPNEDLKGNDEYYSIQLPGKCDRVKGVTAIILKDTPEQKQLPQIEKRQGENWIGVRITALDGKVTDVYINELADGRLMHLNSWIYPDDVATDAYIYVTNPDTDFMVYGSTLRKGRNSVFSSLSKLNFLAEKDGANLNIKVDGQPRINAHYTPGKKFGNITVNGEKSSPAYTNGAYDIKIRK